MDENNKQDKTYVIPVEVERYNADSEKQYEIVRFLYDKEVERANLIFRKAETAFKLLAVDSGLIIFSQKVNFLTAFLLSSAALMTIALLAFSTKINSKKYLDKHLECTPDSIKKYSQRLHETNNIKEIFVYLAYLFCFSAFFSQFAGALISVFIRANH